MNIPEATTIKEAAEVIRTCAKYQPYKYSGRWYIAEVEGVFLAFRSKPWLIKRMNKFGVTQYTDAYI
tara:strand:- start:32979 stop:33179 length:201 start_codon:yes stop_codon:yes gene_type:complete